MHARHARHEAEHTVVRAGDAAQQIQDRQSDRREHPVEHSEDEYGHGGEQSQHQFAATKPRQPPKAGDVDQAQRGVDHQRPERSGGKTGQQAVCEEHHDQQQTQRNQRVELGAGADDFTQRRPAGTGADRKTLAHSGSQVAHAEGAQLGVGIDVVALARGEDPGIEHAVGECDQRDPAGGSREHAQITQRDGGQPERRQPGGHLADDRNAVPIQREQRHRCRGESHRDERAGSTGRQSGQQDQHRQYRGRERQRGPVHVRQRPGQGAHLGEESLAVDGGAGQPAQLVSDHDQRDPGHVADQHRPRQQVGEKAEPDQSGHQAHQSHQCGEHRRQHRVADRVANGQRRQRGCRHQGRGRLRTGREIARRSQDRVDRQRQQRRPQTGYRRQTGHRRIGHRLRHQISRHGDPGQQITAQPGPAVVAELGQSGRLHGCARRCRVRSSRTGIPLRPPRSWA